MKQSRTKIRPPAQLLRMGKRYVAMLIAGIAAISLVLTNVDSIATVWSKYFGQSGEISALGNAINQPVSAPGKNQPVQLELVQTPKEQDSDERVFDIYLKNNSSEDVLLTKLVYGNGYFHTSSGLSHTGAHQLAPDSLYEISVDNSSGETALSPPYLLKSMSRGAVRFRFATPEQFGATTVAFEIFDSAGNKVAAVNTRKGE